MEKLLIICGPTATGKTALAIKLAKKFHGEIISADSRQVYKGMDIGTSKDIDVIPNSRFSIPNEFSIHNFQIGYYIIDDVKVWLYDIVKPDYQFSVADYVKCADLVLADIWQRGKLPILVGGTGLYIKAVIDGIGTMGIAPNRKLRERLLNCSIAELLDKLKKINPEKWQSMNNSDKNNPRRLIRAIEISSVILGSPAEGGTTPESNRNGFRTSQNDDNLLMIGLTADYEILYKRIDDRVDQRIKQGVEREIKRLLEVGYTFENSAMGTTIGYKEWKEYFCHPEFISGSDSGQAVRLPRAHCRRARMTKEMLKQVQHDGFINIIQCWRFAEHAYARRQMTWFRKDERINWFKIAEIKCNDQIERFFNKWYNQKERKAYAGKN